MEFDEHGVCTGCRMAEVKLAIPAAEWRRRRHGLLKQIFERYRCRDGSRHDVVIAVSGGRIVTSRPTSSRRSLVSIRSSLTYDGNNWTAPGWRNMVRTREVFGVDHMLVRPSVDC
jgi:hypothetical protein